MYIVNGDNPYSSDGISDEYLHINSCGFQSHINKDFSIERSKGRLDYHILYITYGCSYIDLNNKTIKASAGDLVIYKPYEKQKYTFYAKDKTESFWIHFTGSGVKDILIKSGLWDDNIYSIGQCDDIKNAIVKMIKEIQLKQCQYEFFCSSYLLSIISTISRQITNHNNSNSIKKFQQVALVLEIMHNQYQNQINIQHYAGLCNLSKDRFMHIFKECTGCSPYKYQIQIRIERAKDFLRNSSLNISEISEIVGYHDPLYFSRVFKRYTGLSPKHWICK